MAIPNTEMVTKVTLMMADKTSLPDLITNDSKIGADKYAETGALIAIDDYIDLMPNYTKFWNSLPEEERERRLMWRKSADGKTYFPQNYGTDNRQGIRAWLYRKDIFEKHNLKVPETMDEVYEVTKELKKLYPDSYPLCMREGLRNINVIGSQWKPNFNYSLYYDFENKKFNYGCTEPVMREIVEYFIKMMSEGLITPDYLSINTKSWEELMSTDRGFILPDYVVRIDNFNNPNRERNPEYTLAAMKPPRANTETGQHLICKYNVDPTGYMICNTGNEERIKNTIRLIDWMYSDEAAMLLSWGKEGETYEVVDGKKRYIRDADEDVQNKYGFFSAGTFLRADPDSAFAMASDEQVVSVKLTLEYTEKDYNPVNWLALKDEDNKRKVELNDGLGTYTNEMLSKFLLGTEPMSKWDEFVNELYELGVEELISLYENAFDAIN
jgi:putative aldouronate transport system substrate-binding protein